MSEELCVVTESVAISLGKPRAGHLGGSREFTGYVERPTRESCFQPAYQVGSFARSKSRKVLTSSAVSSPSPTWRIAFTAR